MRCPYCGTHVADGTAVCPACHASLDQTAVLPRLQGSYCPSCGSLVPEGATSCPKCGMWAQGSRGARRARKPGPAQEAQETGALPRIESALPAEQDLRDPYLHEKPLRMRSVILAAVACIALVGGAVLGITHPWDPDAFSIKATEPADTSQAGFPGVVESLKGQDTVRDGEAEVKSGDETTYEALKQGYNELGDLSGELDASVRRLSDTGITGDSAEREAGRTEAAELAVKISNTISDLESVDVTSGTYTDEKDELVRLGNYLRNRSDIVSAAWSQAASSSDPAAERSQIMRSVEGEGSSYGSLFKEGYAQFSLKAPEGASSE